MKNTMVNEEFKAIAGTDGKYEISNLGRVRSNIGKGKIRKAAKSGRGYMNIILRVNGKNISTTIHRLMADAFIWKPEGSKLTQVNHINGIKDDNRLENLEWVTAGQNMQHARDTGLNLQKGEDHTKAILTEGDIKNIRSLAKGMSGPNIASVYNVSVSTIYAIVSKKTWKHIK